MEVKSLVVYNMHRRYIINEPFVQRIDPLAYLAPSKMQKRPKLPSYREPILCLRISSRMLVIGIAKLPSFFIFSPLSVAAKMSGFAT